MTPAKSGAGFLMGQLWITSAYYTRLLITKCLNAIGNKAQHSLSYLGIESFIAPVSPISSLPPSLPRFSLWYFYTFIEKSQNGHMPLSAAIK